MAEEIKPQEVMEAVTALRDSVKKYGAESIETKNRYEKIEVDLNKFEDYKQAELIKNNNAEKKFLELAERHNTLELEIAKAGAGRGLNHKDTSEYKAMNDFVTKGVIDHKTMRMDNNVSGGYLTSPETDTVVVKQMTEIAPLRSAVRVKTVSKRVLNVPTRTGIPVANYEGEAATGGESQSSYGAETLTTHRLTVTVPYTLDLLNDVDFDLESEINSDVVGESFAFREGNRFVLGTGVKQPEGFLVNPTVVANATNSLGSGVIEAKDLLLLTGQLKVGYNPIFGFNRGSLATFRTFTGVSNDHFIWQAGLGPNVPNTIGGVPYLVIQDMPDIGANSLSVVLADFRRGYTITDSKGLAVVRDEFTRKKEAIVELTFHRWNTGQVILPEAFALLKTLP